MNSDFIVGLHAMVYLHHKGATLRSEELADNICTNSGRVRRVMARLKKAGLVETREGRFTGGYSYEKTRTVTLGEISRAMGTQFADAGWRSGDVRKDCKVACGMGGYVDGLYDELNRRCNDYLDTITVADVERYLFKEKERRTADEHKRTRDNEDEGK